MIIACSVLWRLFYITKEVHLCTVADALKFSQVMIIFILMPQFSRLIIVTKSGTLTVNYNNSLSETCFLSPANMTNQISTTLVFSGEP